MACHACGAPYDRDVVIRTARDTGTLCRGDPENEDLRPRCMVQCASCGEWAGFGDDGERIVGGIVAVPADRTGGPPGSR